MLKKLIDNKDNWNGNIFQADESTRERAKVLVNTRNALAKHFRLRPLHTGCYYHEDGGFNQDSMACTFDDLGEYLIAKLDALRKSKPTGDGTDLENR